MSMATLDRMGEADRRVERGAWLSELDDCAPIDDRDEEYALIERAQAGDAGAMDALIRSQMRWIATLADRVRRPAEMSLEEIIAAGAEGVWLAIVEFKTASGHRLSTYAKYRARFKMWNYVKQNDSLITVPPYPAEGKSRQDMLKASRAFSLDARTVDGATGKPLKSLGDKLANLPAPDPSEANNASHLLHAALERASDLLEAEKRALLCRYLSEDEPLTYQEVASRLKIRTDAARRLCEAAITKIQRANGAEVKAPARIYARGKKKGTVA